MACSMTFTRMDRLAIHFDKANEMKAPPNPNAAENTSNAFISRPAPLDSSICSMPNTRKVTLINSNIEKLVNKNNNIRMI